MEVHHHSHTARKDWTHYFWEFLMLFLAVFCGFLAEYALEHKIENDREKQYIKSFVEDLETDAKSLQGRIDYCDLTIRRADSLIEIFRDPNLAKRAVDVYYFLRWMHRSDFFSVNDRTIVQLRNAGGMRLVSDKSVADSMSSYYKEVENIKFIYEEQVEWRRALRPNFSRLLNGVDWGKAIDEENLVIRSSEPLQLRSTDPDLVNGYILTLNNIKGINMGIKRRMQNLIARGNLIKVFVRKEYHLK